MALITIKDNGRNNKISIDDDVTADINRIPLVISGNDNVIKISSGVQLNTSFINVIGSNCHLEIGCGCRFIRGNLILDQASSIIIGNYNTWASGVFRAEHETSIIIGNECMFAADIHIRTSDGHGIFDKITKERLNDSADVIIGDHVWLGQSSSVGKGVEIQRGTVLGQMSLATGKLQANSIYAGVPAKKIKDGITWTSGLTYDSIPKHYR
jgi:acetyltransferase-like isoleucine patch superfamily enzyme